MEALLYPETGATFLNPRTPFPTARTARGPIMLRNVHRSSEPCPHFPAAQPADALLQHSEAAETESQDTASMQA